MNNKNDFTPYVAHNQTMSEITFTSVITGIILAVIFGAANAYLGLRVGLTVSASIPAAVTAMGIIRIVLKRNSILESNIVQTIGSAGESLAAGAIFTIPAIFLWASEGKCEKPEIFDITAIALAGGLLGVFFMIPLRKALIVKEHKTLPYPEGSACAQVLLSGEKEAKSSGAVFSGIGIGALFKFIVDGLKLAESEIALKIKGFAGQMGIQVYPAIIGVGYICGPKISGTLFSGGILSWLVLIPLVVIFGENALIGTSQVSAGEIYSQSGAEGIWSTYIRYIGAGALAAAGIISLVKTFPLIVRTFFDAIKGLNAQDNKTLLRTEQDLNIKLVLFAVIFLIFMMWHLPAIPIGITGSLIVTVFGFFFAAVSSRMVGLVGSSNNPVSGMAIATLIGASLILKLFQGGGISSMIGAISIGSVICIISAIAGDTSQDLKTGFLLGATPKKQQIAELIGVGVSALTIGATLYLLDSAWGFGSKELAAPQATLMKIITEGVMEGNLPWGLVICGAFISICVSLAGVSPLPFAIGVYLPVSTTSCIMVGGVLRWIFERCSKDAQKRDLTVQKGILASSGLIAGEGIVGIILAFMAVLGVDSFIDLSSDFSYSFRVASAIILLAIFPVVLWKISKHSKV